MLGLSSKQGVTTSIFRGKKLNIFQMATNNMQNNNNNINMQKKKNKIFIHISKKIATKTFFGFLLAKLMLSKNVK